MDLVTKQKTTLWLIIVLVILNITTLVMLWLPGEARRIPGRHSTPPKDRTFFKELNLSMEQEKQFDQYRSEYFRVIGKYTRQINRKKYEIMEMLFKTEPDSQKLNVLTDELGLLNAKFEKVRFRQILKMKTILSDDQFNIFKKIVDVSYKPRPGDMDGRVPPHEFDERGPDNMPPPPPDGKHRPGDRPPPPPDD